MANHFALSGTHSGAALARAYGLLLMSRWFDAEEAAREVLAADATDQFALYVAAEAALQRGDLTATLKYVEDARQITIVDPALRAFMDDFRVAREGPATVAGQRHRSGIGHELHQGARV